MGIERFIGRLVKPLYRAVAPQMKSFPSYSTVVDYSKMLEMNEMEALASQEKTKKHNIGLVKVVALLINDQSLKFKGKYSR